MIRQRDVSLTLALCASLFAHGLIAYAFSEGYVASVGKIWLPGMPRSDAIAARVQPVPPPQYKFGEPDGVGQSTDSAPGDEPMIAPEGPQEQALLSREPAARAPSEEVAASRELPFGIAPSEDGGYAPVGTTRPKRQRSSAAGVAGGVPAPKSETDSDPFSVNGGVEFRPGKTEARFGRAHRFTRPPPDLTSNVDLAFARSISMVLHLRLDRAGNVVRAEVRKTSGSANLDQIYKLTAYKWWFEPRPNVETEEFDLTLRFY